MAAGAKEQLLTATLMAVSVFSAALAQGTTFDIDALRGGSAKLLDR